jgi:hypothetical protein
MGDELEQGKSQTGQTETDSYALLLLFDVAFY